MKKGGWVLISSPGTHSRAQRRGSSPTTRPVLPRSCTAYRSTSARVRRRPARSCVSHPVFWRLTAFVPPRCAGDPAHIKDIGEPKDGKRGVVLFDSIVAELYAPGGGLKHGAVRCPPPSCPETFSDPAPPTRAQSRAPSA